jgi:hypothetical protein
LLTANRDLFHRRTLLALVICESARLGKRSDYLRQTRRNY